MSEKDFRNEMQFGKLCITCMFEKEGPIIYIEVDGDGYEQSGSISDIQDVDNIKAIRDTMIEFYDIIKKREIERLDARITTIEGRYKSDLELVKDMVKEHPTK